MSIIAVATVVKHDEATPLQEWASAHEPGETMIWKGGYWTQIQFVRDRFADLFYDSFEKWKAHPVRAVGTHTSKSIQLPVFSIAVPGVVEVRLRYNFHDWVISVAAEQPVEVDFFGMFDPAKEQLDCYSEGFESAWVFRPYAEDRRHFSLSLDHEHDLYVFGFLLTTALGLRSRIN